MLEINILGWMVYLMSSSSGNVKKKCVLGWRFTSSSGIVKKMFLDEGFIPCHPELLRKCSWIRVYLVIRFVKKKGVLGWSTYHTKKPLGIRGHHAWELQYMKYIFETWFTLFYCEFFKIFMPFLTFFLFFQVCLLCFLFRLFVKKI